GGQRPGGKDAAGPELALVRAPRVVAGRGKVGGASADYRVHGLGDDAVLEHRLGQVQDVVDEHARAAGLEREDVVGEARLATVGGRKCERSPGRHVVDDLKHGAALVCAVAASRALLEYLDGGEVSGADVGIGSPEAIEAVRQHADLHP